MWKFLCKRANGNEVLELASGTGRITFSLLKEGHSLTGIDLSKSIYDYACKLAKQYKYINCTFLNENMTNFNLHNKFDIIIIGFNSFLHLLNDDEARACLNCVEKVLKDSKISKSEIDDIVLVGGTTRIPKMQQLLKEYGGK